MKEAKKALRRKMKALRDGISPEEKAELDRRIRKNLFSSEVYQRSQTIFCYISAGSESDTREILRRAWADGKTVAVPKCLPDHKMIFCIIDSLDECISGAYGIPEPVEHCREASPAEENIICIVPGLAFDKNGGRLGYGGGYYDRFLEKHPHIYTIGLCSESFVLDAVPMEDTDRRLDSLVTEKTMEVNNGREKLTKQQ